MKMSKWNVIVVCLFTSFVVNAQLENRALGYFTVDAGNESVLLSWQLNRGFTCNGITVERRLDADSVFKTVGVIKGLCGSPTQPIDYTFTDTTVEQNNAYYYRLILGAEGHTMHRRVLVRAPQADRLWIYPNPALEEITIRLDDPPASDVRIIVVATSGTVLLDENKAAKEAIAIDVSRLPTGRYILIVEGDGFRETKSIVIKQY